MSFEEEGDMWRSGMDMKPTTKLIGKPSKQNLKRLARILILMADCMGHVEHRPLFFELLIPRQESR